MKTRKIYRRPLWAALTVVASLFLALLITAPQVEANTGAGATILNTVGINYYDASGTTNYLANASTTVSVNLVRAALTISGRPTATTKGVTAAMPAGVTVASGTTQTYLIALTANANGGDTYALTDAISGVTNMASDSVTWATVKPDGATVETGSSPAAIPLGASVIQANTATTISIPGGSTLAAAITTGSIKTLVVYGVDYLVSGSISANNAPSNTNVGATYYNTTGTATAETLAVITLIANPSGANVAPNFTVNGLIGTVAAEQQLVLVSVTGVVGTTVGTNGTVLFTLTTKDGAGGNSVSMASAITTTFYGSNLQVMKSVRNCGPAGTNTPAFAATATGNPGDILEYQVKVYNAGLSQATKVAASDAVPVYTQLICGTAVAYGVATVCPSVGAATLIFATITDGTTTTLIPYGGGNTCVSPGVGAGLASGYLATSALNYYFGNTTTCNATTGGTVNAAATYTITYRVKMN